MFGRVARKRVEVRGIVQGVGFRPFVYNLAERLGLSGFVRNTSEAVIIEVEGDRADAFADELRSGVPALAQIDSLLVSDLAPDGESGFRILSSAGSAGEFVLVPPDIATCEDCRRDFTDPANRRYGYPFTNCTNCGPRYTIIEDIPYDRSATTMSVFTMCPNCEAEYRDPANRRFHAQPNACPVCGPSLSAPLDEVRAWLRSGEVVAIKGLGGFHLACDAMNDAAVRRLRERKRRSDKPFALMAPTLRAIEKLCVLDDAAGAILSSPRSPIVILPRREGCPVSPAVAPGNRTLGVMLPYTPLHHLLFKGGEFEALVMTSGNLSEEPIVSSEDELPRLEPLADRFLVHNRRIRTRVDDSVVRVFEGRELVLRRSRGYAPVPVALGREVDQVLACGGELKNTFCLTKDRYAILSQHIGDLENYETMVFFEETLEHMKRFFRVEPRAVAHDLHPNYLSTKFAQAIEGVRKIGVQHHHAHIAACMAENRLDGPVIGVAFDGTGYGTDGKIWGGEFLLADYAGFERRAHLRYVPLAGGDAAIRQPWRSALAYLNDAGLALELPVEPRARAVVERMIERRINTVDTSSCGRLFDAVASLAGVRQETNYEGQAAIELEALAAGGIRERYPFTIRGEEIDMRPAIAGVVEDVRLGRQAPEISARFHNTVAAMVVEVCSLLSRESGLNRVCLSGGTFQNFYLLERVVGGLRQGGLEVFLHSQVPPNDGCIALGQAMVANALLERSERR